jgi:hypothetical protein
VTDQSGNLKRGNLSPTDDPGVTRQPHGGALVTDGSGWARTAAKKKAEADELRRRIHEEEGAALEEIHFRLTSLTKKILTRAEREGKVPPKTTMDVVKEFRQTQEAVNHARQARGAVAEAEDFFASLDGRVAEALERAGAPNSPVAV